MPLRSLPRATPPPPLSKGLLPNFESLASLEQVSEHTLSPADECLILGCDGLWDVLSAEEAWELASRAGKARGSWDYAAAAKALVDAALQRKTGDNVSVVVIGLRKPRAPPQAGAAPGYGARPRAKLLPR